MTSKISRADYGTIFRSGERKIGLICVAVTLATLAFAAPSAHASFGIVPGSFKTMALNENGSIDRQAGSHPYEYVADFKFNEDAEGHLEGDARTINVEVPPGLVGDPTAIPRCPRVDFDGFSSSACPADTQVGILIAVQEQITTKTPLYNVVPPKGVPLTFGFTLAGLNNLENASVRSGSDYGVDVDTNNVVAESLVSVEQITWGVPAAESHTPERWCMIGGTTHEGGCVSGATPKPFLTLPTSCSDPLQAGIRVASVEDPSDLLPAQSAFSLDDAEEPAALSGCEQLAFDPALTLAPDTANADTPAGLTAEVHVGQGGLEDVEGVSAANIKNTTVTLPAGLAINPGQAAGLVACGPGEDGLTTPAEKEKGEEDTAPAHCPSASKVGTVQIRTPLLEEELAGNVYILPSNPPHLQILLAANDPVDGIYLKLVGDVELGEENGSNGLAPGQLRTTFTETPELPFTSFRLSFNGGAQAALATPTQCGVYTSDTDFTPWSTPFTPDLLSSTSFAISSGPGDGPCPSGPLPFSPSMIAGSTTDQAGGFTDFSLLLQRGDGQQRIEKLQFKAPPGLAGLISRVPLCTNAQAEAPPTESEPSKCPAASEIGHTVVTSGPGPYPLVVPQPGQPPAPIYLTEGYDGAPFGLAIVVPLHVGPFTLETQKVRAKIEIDPTTAQITVTTNPLPPIVDGVPTDLRSIDAVIDREDFMFNPTNCNESAFTGTAWGTAPPGLTEPGETASLSSHFGVGSCRSLKFEPKVSVSTLGHATKRYGQSLTFKISYPNGAMGNDAWFNEAKFDIPKQLPAELKAIQQACLAHTFETDRSACPVHSVIGHATVRTQVLPVPLEGPVYFVSYGGAKFPDAVMVLSGDNVNITLTGETFINNKTGVTSATFPNTPDVPFESIEVDIPTGEYSEFGSNLPKGSYDFCGQKLKMPTLFKASNGLEIHEETPVAITGCAPTRAQQLATALAACKKDKKKSKRASCEKAARKKYGAKASKSSKKKKR